MNNSGKHNPAYKHGHTTGGFSPEYHSWSSMLQRCTNPKRHGYQHYGGKGIKVCDRWKDFTSFLADMGPRPTGKTLERLDGSKDYGPENCCWADKVTQNRNNTQVVWVEINGVTERLLDWCKIYKISVNTVRCRVRKHNMTYTAAITTPIQSTPGVPL